MNEKILEQKKMLKEALTTLNAITRCEEVFDFDKKYVRVTVDQLQDRYAEIMSRLMASCLEKSGLTLIDK